MPEHTDFYVGWGTLSLINAGLAQAKAHITQVHLCIDPYACPTCPSEDDCSFYDRESLLEHFRLQHPGLAPPLGNSVQYRAALARVTLRDEVKPEESNDHI